MDITSRTLDNEQVQRKAFEALELLEAMDHDSFGPTNAVRAIAGYDALTPADREAINAALVELIERG